MRTSLSGIVVLFQVTNAVDLVFPVEVNPSAPIALTILATLAVNTSEVTLHDSISCNSSAFVTASFNGSFVGNRNNPAVSFYTIDPRPSVDLTTVCVDNLPVGHIQFHEPPVLVYDRHPVFPKQSVGIRQFVNPGWTHKFPPIMCKDCDAHMNTMALKSVVTGIAPCSGRREEHNAFFNITTSEKEPVSLFPFRVEVAYTSAHQVFQAWTLSTDHLSMYEDALADIKGPLQICFYSDSMAASGTYLGEAEFMMSENDTSGLVFFLLFIGIALPIITIVSVALHCFRLTRHRQFARSLKHMIQGVQLEREMLLVPAQPVSQDIVV